MAIDDGSATIPGLEEAFREALESPLGEPSMVAEGNQEGVTKVVTKVDMNSSNESGHG